jgi:hypothetical protein
MWVLVVLVVSLDGHHFERTEGAIFRNAAVGAESSAESACWNAAHIFMRGFDRKLEEDYMERGVAYCENRVDLELKVD